VTKSKAQVHHVRNQAMTIAMVLGARVRIPKEQIEEALIFLFANEAWRKAAEERGREEPTAFDEERAEQIFRERVEEARAWFESLRP